MRIDVFLKHTRLIKQREAAKKACDQGMVTMEGKPVKPGREVHVGDRFSVEWPTRRVEVEVLDIPAGNVSKTRSQTLYRLLGVVDITDIPPDFGP
ncbi:MAG: RNA-binding S4 domain-containing protein [candidate division Zixibacteria bacterium]|nr:RNA-binding S4 domain-containing protein [candidate division Zixibacteria bacterium]